MFLITTKYTKLLVVRAKGTNTVRPRNRNTFSEHDTYNTLKYVIITGRYKFYNSIRQCRRITRNFGRGSPEENILKYCGRAPFPSQSSDYEIGLLAAEAACVLAAAPWRPSKPPTPPPPPPLPSSPRFLKTTLYPVSTVYCMFIVKSRAVHF